MSRSACPHPLLPTCVAMVTTGRFDHCGCLQVYVCVCACVCVCVCVCVCEYANLKVKYISLIIIL